jgi:hypothetical protein
MPDTLIAVGGSLPRISFRQVSAPGTVSWNQGTKASVVFLPHTGHCPGCASYMGELADSVDGLKEWATRAMVLVPPTGDLSWEAPGLLVLVDDDGGQRRRLGVGDDRAVVVQADRWGAVYEVESADRSDEAHEALPRARDLVALAKFIDIQCPECEVPSREWLAATPFPLG